MMAERTTRWSIVGDASTTAAEEMPLQRLEASLEHTLADLLAQRPLTRRRQMAYSCAQTPWMAFHLRRIYHSPAPPKSLGAV